MTAILTILTSIISGACFFAVYEYGYRKGFAKAEEENKKEQVIQVTKKNQRAFKKAAEFANYNG